jgi:hypothetical protein
MFIDNPSKRLLVSFLIAATNIFSFAFGSTLAGDRRPNVDVVAASSGAPTPILSPTGAARPSAKPNAAKVVAAPDLHAADVAAIANAAPSPTIPVAGKGMWIYEFDLIMGGNVKKIVDVSKAYGLTHLYVRAGTTRSGLDTWPDVLKILPVAHAAGLKVIPWYFPYLRNPAADARRTIAMVRTVINGHRVDGFAADIETRAEGTKLSTKAVKQYIDTVRKGAPEAFMILVPPRPNSHTVRFYPYHLVPRFNAVAPMVYWGGVDPAKATADAVSYLKRYNRPVAPIGQVYDMGPEGGPKGRPKPPALRRFMTEARTRGSVGFSFWSWQHSAIPQWVAIRAFAWP